MTAEPVAATPGASHKPWDYFANSSQGLCRLPDHCRLKTDSSMSARHGVDEDACREVHSVL